MSDNPPPAPKLVPGPEQEPLSRWQIIWRSTVHAALLGLILSPALVGIGVLFLFLAPGQKPKLEEFAVGLPIIALIYILMFAAFGFWDGWRSTRRLAINRVLCLVFQTGQGEKKDYADLAALLETFFPRHQATPNTWFVRTERSIVEVCAEFLRCLDEKDTLILVTVAEGNDWGYCLVPEPVTRWAQL